MGGNSRNLTAFKLPFAGTTKLYGYRLIAPREGDASPFLDGPGEVQIDNAAAIQTSADFRLIVTLAYRVLGLPVNYGCDGC